MTLRPVLAALSAALAPVLEAGQALETVRFKDKFTLLFPAPRHERSDTAAPEPAAVFSRLDSLYRLDARVSRSDLPERKATMEKAFWESGLKADEVEKREQLANGDFFLCNRPGDKVKAVYFAKGARGYLQVNVTGPDSLRTLAIRIARSLRNVEPLSAPQAAVPLKLEEYVFDPDSLRVLVPQNARPDPRRPAAWYAPVDELDNVRIYTMSGFDYPYDEAGKWQGPEGEEKLVERRKLIDGPVDVLEMRPRGALKEFHCYLGEDRENKVVVAGPRELADAMRLMAESIGIRRSAGHAQR